MRFTLKDREFVIEESELTAVIPDPHWSKKYNPAGNHRLAWLWEIAGSPATGNDLWGVSIDCRNLHLPVRRWMDISGRVTEWTAVLDGDLGEPNGTFYLLEHVSIPQFRLTFCERDNTRFRFEGAGVCDVYWNEEYDRAVPFSVAGWTTFTGVIVNGSETDTEQSLWQRLAEYLDPRDFKQGALYRDGHYNDGVEMLRTEFTPVV